MAHFSSIDDAEQWVDDWQARLQEKSLQVREMTARIHGLRGAAETRNGSVRVVVEATGVPVEIKLDRSVASWEPDRIASEILATMRQAQVQLTRSVEEAANATVGIESPTAQAILANYYTRFPQESSESKRTSDRW